VTRGSVGPYAAALGDRMPELHPRLHAYFSSIPTGMVGVGAGVFDVVGTPRRWLWPALAVLGRQGILFPAWQHDVPFTVRNTPALGGGVAAERRFEFARGPRTMVDAMSWQGGLVDRLGRSGLLVARFRVSVARGELHLASTRVGIGISSRVFWLPSFIAPTVQLTERFDDVADHQRVDLRIEHPLLGRLYEYAGSFTYVLQQGDGAA
jgi:hypothetical protein